MAYHKRDLWSNQTSNFIIDRFSLSEDDNGTKDAGECGKSDTIINNFSQHHSSPLGVSVPFKAKTG